MLSPTLENKHASMKLCVAIKEGDAHGRVIEDVRRVVRLPSYASDWSDVFFPQCFPDPGDPLSCHPEFAWTTTFFNNSTTKALLGVADHVNYTSFSNDVFYDFRGNADM